MQVTGQNPKKKYNYWASQIAVPGLLRMIAPCPADAPQRCKLIGMLTAA
jgi:hypothetical protein